MPRLKSKCSINIWHSVSLPQVNTLGFGDRNVLSDADFVAVVIFIGPESDHLFSLVTN